MSHVFVVDSGVEYQQGDLFGYEVREYCLEKWGRVCAYCDATGVPLQTQRIVPLLIEACGRGHRRIMVVDKHGFPRGYRQRQKRYFGYQTGDLVRAVVPKGARKGTHVGRVAVKASGYFTIQTKSGPVPDVAHRYCTMQQRTDGYRYHFGKRLSPSTTSQKGAPVSSPA